MRPTGGPTGCVAEVQVVRQSPSAEEVLLRVQAAALTATDVWVSGCAAEVWMSPGCPLDVPSCAEVQLCQGTLLGCQPDAQ